MASSPFAFQAALRGLAVGLAATLAMTLWEWPFWRKLGLASVPDWQVNQLVLSLLNRRPPEANLYWGLLLHFLAGAAGGILFTLNTIDVPGFPGGRFMEGVVFGTVLWVLVLGLQRRLVGTSLGWQGARAAGISLVAHWIYGVVLGAFG